MEKRKYITNVDIRELAEAVSKEYSRIYKNKIISPIKMQKSLYLLEYFWGNFITSGGGEVDVDKYSEYLFFAKFQAWAWGPVIKAVHNHKDVYENIEEIDDKVSLKNIFKDKFVLEFVESNLKKIFKTNDFTLIDVTQEHECFKKVRPIHKAMERRGALTTPLIALEEIVNDSK